MGQFYKTSQGNPLDDFVYQMDKDMALKAVTNIANNADKAENDYNTLLGEFAKFKGYTDDQPDINQYVENTYNNKGIEQIKSLTENPLNYQMAALKAKELGMQYQKDLVGGKLRDWKGNLETYEKLVKDRDEKQELFTKSGGKHGTGSALEDAELQLKYYTDTYRSKLPLYKQTDKVQKFNYDGLYNSENFNEILHTQLGVVKPDGFTTMHDSLANDYKYTVKHSGQHIADKKLREASANLFETDPTLKAKYDRLSVIDSNKAAKFKEDYFLALKDNIARHRQNITEDTTSIGQDPNLQFNESRRAARKAEEEAKLQSKLVVPVGVEKTDLENLNPLIIFDELKSVDNTINNTNVEIAKDLFKKGIKPFNADGTLNETIAAKHANPELLKTRSTYLNLKDNYKNTAKSTMNVVLEKSGINNKQSVVDQYDGNLRLFYEDMEKFEDNNGVFSSQNENDPYYKRLLKVGLIDKKIGKPNKYGTTGETYYDLKLKPSVIKTNMEDFEKANNQIAVQKQSFQFNNPDTEIKKQFVNLIGTMYDKPIASFDMLNGGKAIVVLDDGTREEFYIQDKKELGDIAKALNGNVTNGIGNTLNVSDDAMQYAKGLEAAFNNYPIISKDGIKRSITIDGKAKFVYAKPMGTMSEETKGVESMTFSSDGSKYYNYDDFILLNTKK